MKNFLPLGSVVLLQGASKRIMIAGRLQRNEENGNLYDYCGYPFPEGMQNPEEMVLFNNENIETVYFVGAQDEEEMKMQKLLGQKAEELGSPEEPIV